MFQLCINVASAKCINVASARLRLPENRPRWSAGHFRETIKKQFLCSKNVLEYEKKKKFPSSFCKERIIPFIQLDKEKTPKNKDRQEENNR